jgi:hypothetical protein
MPNDTRPFWLVWGANKHRCHEANQATFATALHDQVPAKWHYENYYQDVAAVRLHQLTHKEAGDAN